MHGRRTLRCLLLAVAVASLPAPAAFAAQIVVFAAASLKNALDAVAADWASGSGDSATISYAASSALARQIEAGAPADVFFSADLDWMDYLAERGLIDPATRRNLLGNRIVLIAPAPDARPVAVGYGFDLAGALDGGKLAMANVDSVPAGKYGKAALESLGVWDSVAGRASRRPRTSARRCRSSRSARRRSASSTPPTPMPSRGSASSAPSPMTRTRRSSTRWPAPQPAPAMPRGAFSPISRPPRRARASRPRVSPSWSDRG